MAEEPRPNVLIFEPLVSHLRITDKFVIDPPTTYISKSLRKVLQERKDLVEYRQANVTNEAVVSACYNDPSPNGRLYTHVIDLAGDYNYEHPAGAHIAHTLAPAVIIARCSAAQLARFPGSIKAHFRLIPPFYEHVDPKKRYKEDDPKGWQFNVGKGAIRALWWHETTRAVGNVEGLPLVMLKIGIPYGPGLISYELTSIILLGLVYQSLDRDMRMPWSPKLPKNTIQMMDLAGLIWAAVEWASTKTREEANVLAGVPVYPSNDPSVNAAPPLSSNIVPASAGAVVIPIFNACDDSDSTQGSISEVVSDVFGIKVAFNSRIIDLLSRWRMKDIAESVNETHVEQWTKIIAASNPPVPDTPLSPYFPLYQLEEHGCALDIEKTRKLIKYQFRFPQFSKAGVLDFIEWCRREGIWPETGDQMATS